MAPSAHGAGAPTVAWRRRRDLALVLAVKAAIGAIVLLGGFRAISDDDFARVVHAQDFAFAPRLDPTGTSWLPLPFWLTGGVMLLAGTSLTTARVIAFAAGLASAALLYAAARLLIADPRNALFGALTACLFPWSARLGVATVPELPAAALSVFALATLVRPDPRLRFAGALALLAATLCRYEPWLLAAAFAAFTLVDIVRASPARARILHIAAIVAALLGPALWILHNARAHGDPLHFLERVSAYKRAISGDAVSPLKTLASYPLSLLREEPELSLFAVFILVAMRRARLALPTTLTRPAIALAAMLVLLSLASLSGGAPTHHAGRALLAIWLTAAIYVGAAVPAALRPPHRDAFAFATIIVIPFGAFVLRPIYARMDAFIARTPEVAIGRALAGRAPGERALLETRDYAFFAIQAGSGTPHLLVPDQPDPYEGTSSFTSIEALRTRAHEADATLVVCHHSAATAALGPPIALVDAWGVWRMPPSP